MVTLTWIMIFLSIKNSIDRLILYSHTIVLYVEFVKLQHRLKKSARACIDI